jgi:hypothetical protein
MKRAPKAMIHVSLVAYVNPIKIPVAAAHPHDLLTWYRQLEAMAPRRKNTSKVSWM